MPKSYIVGVREVHVRQYRVKAENQGEARSLVGTRGSEVIDLQFSEYSHELGSDTWSVDEENEKGSWNDEQKYRTKTNRM